MIIDDKTLLDNIEWEQVDTEHITIKVNGKQLKKDLYKRLEFEATDQKDRTNSITILNDLGILAEIHYHELLTEKETRELAKQLRDQLNNTIKSTLKIKD